jgi:hypothetical protein
MQTLFCHVVARCARFRGGSTRAHDRGLGLINSVDRLGFARTPIAARVFHENQIADCSSRDGIAAVYKPAFEQRLFEFDHRGSERGYSTRPQVRNCAPGNLEILRCAIAHRSSMLRIAPE